MIPIPEHEHLVCPECRYNLTGLTVPRCPECGASFDVWELRRMASTRPTPATPWEREGGLRGFWKTLQMSLLRPGRLAADFPRCPLERMGTWYSLICYGLGMSLALGLTEAGSPTDTATAGVFGIGAVVAFFVYGAITAAWFATFDTLRDANEAYSFWRGLLHYGSGFAILFGVIGGAGPVLDALGFRGRRWFDSETLVALGGLISWLGMSLYACRVYGRRGTRGWRTAFALLGPILGSGAGAFCGVTASMLAAALAQKFLR